MTKLNRLKWVVAIATAFFVGVSTAPLVSANAGSATNNQYTNIHHKAVVKHPNNAKAKTGQKQARKAVTSVRSQGVDWAKYQGYNGVKGYKNDQFAIAQIGGSYGGTFINQSTYNSQVASALSQGMRAHTYIWYGVGGSKALGKQCLDYYLPRVKTPKGSIVALDYEDGASGSVKANTDAIIAGMQQIKDAGYTPMYYSYKPYTLAHVDYKRIVQRFGTCLWIAAYPDYLVRSTPYWGTFPTMDGVAIYQFTSTYIKGGLDGNIDLTGITKNGYNGKTPTLSKPNKSVKPANKKAVHVTYALHQKGKKWLNPVKDFGSGSNGFAGVPNSVHDMLYIKVNRGSIKYRVHTKEDGWLPWVHKANKKDTVNGVAGIKGHTIDGVQMYYTTPSGETYQQAYYRSQSTQRSGYLGTCADNGSVAGYDSFAGMLGEPLDRLQISINNSSEY
ncbi:1,4-beta-N-acetylmuramidase [Pediococcus acidilactici]|uniref:GH25 family lysozyme n=1 Tax=Pediococcus acidilactici TaxID=1254 RepID=UPI00132F6236|nr:GH25 family lysozyme [Pediococcus acidilactici]KAF0388283.1 1,4-beta-N-acetylmuramidase [Pediococcus acidilactici]KAF0800859.1 1,4-beta-N-acetylmuramidase [Pediococcus acidilactici]